GALWHNGRLIEDRAEGAVLLDLQPGSNDVLVGISGIFPVALHVRAKGAVSLSLPDKTDGAALAERLKAAKGTPVPPEFLKIDWAVEGKRGDAERGRKLFGSLGCARCHAI